MSLLCSMREPLPLRRSAICGPLEAPPNKHVLLTPKSSPNLSATLATCWASSLVGTNTKHWNWYETLIIETKQLYQKIIEHVCFLSGIKRKTTLAFLSEGTMRYRIRSKTWYQRKTQWLVALCTCVEAGKKNSKTGIPTYTLLCRERYKAEDQLLLSASINSCVTGTGLNFCYGTAGTIYAIGNKE